MRAKGRSVWRNKKTGRWVAEARVATLDGSYKKLQRSTNSEAKAIELADSLYEKLKSKTSGKLPQSFSELVQNYLELNQSYSRDVTLANNKYLLEKYVLPAFGRKHPGSISPIELLSLMKDLRRRGLATSTVNKIRAVISVVFQTSKTFGLEIPNPASAVRPLRPFENEKTQVEEPWSIEEVKKVLKVFRDTQLDAFIHISTSLGLRRGEILGLRWRDIDFVEGIIHVRENRGSRRSIDSSGRVVTRMTSGPLKTAASKRKLRLTPLLSLSLIRHRELLHAQGSGTTKDDFVILGVNGLPMNESSLYKFYNATCKANGIRRIRIHDHRHTAAVIALSQKVDPIVASYGLGHASFEITKRIYAQTVPLLSAEFSDSIGNALFEGPEAGEAFTEEGVIS